MVRTIIMNKKKILLFSFIVLFLIFLIIRWDEFVIESQLRIRCITEYWGDYTFCKSYVDEDKKNITVDFVCNKNINDNNKHVIFLLYDELYDIVFNKEKYNCYTFELRFEHRSGEARMVFRSANKEKDSLEIYCAANSVDVKDIASNCPETKRLTISLMEYDSIEDFSEFIELEELKCRYDIIDIDEKRYILSLFPDCEIGWYEH